MAIDLSENGQGYNDLKAHIGHKIVCVGYGKKGSINQVKNPVNIAIECETCNCVLVDFEKPDSPNSSDEPVVKGFGE